MPSPVVLMRSHAPQSATTSQFFISYTIKTFGALVFATIMTTRQVSALVRRMSRSIFTQCQLGVVYWIPATDLDSAKSVRLACCLLLRAGFLFLFSSWPRHGPTSCFLPPFLYCFLQLLSILLSSIIYGPPLTTGQYGGTVSVWGGDRRGRVAGWLDRGRKLVA